MKKALFVVLIACTSISTNAQLCSNCQTKAVTTENIVFRPILFEPIALGASAGRMGYIKDVPSGILPIRIICYFYLRGADGKIVEVGYPASIIRTLSNPSDWFVGTNPAAPNTYLQPRPIPMIVEVKQDVDATGRAIINPDGTYAVHYDIYF